MKYRFIEAYDVTKFNHGKFMVAKFDEDDRAYHSPVYNTSLLRACGWGPQHIVVMDLQTGEGVMVSPHGLAKADLDNHKVWVCPMFEPFLTWLYTQDLSDITKLPRVVNLGYVPIAMHGYRRGGEGHT